MNEKNTKKNLTMSAISMLLCVVMLVGLTFAWFTDSVTNKGNRIQAGNLKIDLLMDKDGTGSGKYVSIADGMGDIFSEGGNGSNWEPGKTEIVYLAVQNKGNLAFNYNILLNVTDGNPGLAGSLEYAVLDGKTPTDLAGTNSWTDLKAMAGGQTGDVAAGEVTAAPNGTLDEIIKGSKNETQYFALAVHMKESAGNEYAKGSITIDVNVVAKQAMAENDSFGNTYDESAVWPIVKVNSTQELSEALTAGGTVVLTQDITIASDEMDSLVIDKDTTIRLDNHKLDVTGVGTAKKEKILVNNGATLTIDGKETGGVTYAAADTAPRLFSVEKGSKLVINGGDFVITKTNTPKDGQGIYLDEGCTFEMNGGSITADNGTALNIAGKNCNVVINDGTLFSRNGNSAVNVSAGSTLQMNGGEVIVQNDSDKFSAAFSGSRNAGEIVINDGRVAGPVAFNMAQNQKVTVNGGTIESARLNYGSKLDTLLTINNGAIIGTGTDDEGSPAVVLDKGNVELRGGVYSPNYLYARNGANVKIFAAVYNGSNPPVYGTDENSTIIFG